MEGRVKEAMERWNAQRDDSPESRFLFGHVIYPLSLNEESQSLFVAAGCVDKVIAYHNVQHNVVDKENVMAFLANLSMHSENKVVMGRNPALLKVAVKAAGSGATARTRELGLELLSFLASHEANQIIMARYPPLLQAAAHAVGQGSGNTLREAGLKLILHLSMHDDNVLVLGNNPAVVQACVEATDKGTTSQIRERGIMLLGNLARHNEIKISFVRNPAVLQAVLKAIGEGSTDKIREVAMVTLACISEEEASTIPMAGNLVVVQAVLKGAAKVTTEVMREKMVTLLANLSIHDENQSMLERNPAVLPGILKIAIKATSKGTKDKTKNYTLKLLLNLAICEANRVIMASNPAILQFVIEAVDEGITDEMKLIGFMVLTNFSKHPANQVAMANHSTLIQVTLEATRAGRPSQIKNSALALLTNFCSNREVAAKFATHVRVLVAAMTSIDTHPLFANSILLWLSPFPSAALAIDNPIVLEKLFALLTNSDLALRFRASMVLCNCIGMDRNRSGVLRRNLNNFMIVIHLLDYVLSPKSVHEKLEHVTNWTLSMAVYPIYMLSMADTNRAYLTANGIDIVSRLSAALSMAITQNDTTAALYAIDAIQQYAFDKTTLRAELQHHYRDDVTLSLTTIISKSDDTDGKWSDAKKSAQHLMARIDGDLARVDIGVKPFRNNAMNVRLSYNVADEELAEKVSKYLEMQGIAVWRNMTPMKLIIVVVLSSSASTSLRLLRPSFCVLLPCLP